VRLLGGVRTPEDLLSLASPVETGSQVSEEELVGAGSTATDGGT
jgi:hypothetical protein